MRKDLSKYILKIDTIIKSGKVTNDTLKNHLIKIYFFQHERLIHLLVTLSFAIFTIAFIALSFINSLFSFISIITFIMLAFYISHYFFLENSVQYLYKQYDLLKDKLDHVSIK